MSVYVYKLPEFLLNSWTNFERAQLDVANIEEDDEFIQPWREEVAARLDEGGELMSTLGFDGEFDPKTDLWFAPLPVASPLSLSAYMIAIAAADAIYVISPFELSWLASGALASASDRDALH